MQQKLWSGCLVLIAALPACGKSKKDQPAPPIHTIDCSTPTLAVNSCLDQQKLVLVGIKDLDQLAAEMAAVTVACKPSPQEFKEFLCQFKLQNP